MIDSMHCIHMLSVQNKVEIKKVPTNDIFLKFYLGELAVFKAVVTGEPKPDVSWRRAKGAVTDKDKFQRTYNESTGEHILEVTN